MTEGTMRLIFTSAALLAPYMGVGPMMFGTIDSTPRCAATSSSHRLCDGYEVRYKSMRGHKSMEGMSNAIALTQWLYDGEDEHDLAKEMAA